MLPLVLLVACFPHLSWPAVSLACCQPQGCCKLQVQMLLGQLAASLKLALIRHRPTASCFVPFYYLQSTLLPLFHLRMSHLKAVTDMQQPLATTTPPSTSILSTILTLLPPPFCYLSFSLQAAMDEELAAERKGLEERATQRREEALARRYMYFVFVGWQLVVCCMCS